MSTINWEKLKRRESGETAWRDAIRLESMEIRARRSAKEEEFSRYIAKLRKEEQMRNMHPRDRAWHAAVKAYLEQT